MVSTSRSENDHASFVSHQPKIGPKSILIFEELQRNMYYIIILYSDPLAFAQSAFNPLVLVDFNTTRLAADIDTRRPYSTRRNEVLAHLLQLHIFHYFCLHMAYKQQVSHTDGISGPHNNYTNVHMHITITIYVSMYVCMYACMHVCMQVGR